MATTKTWKYVHNGEDQHGQIGNRVYHDVLREGIIEAFTHDGDIVVRYPDGNSRRSTPGHVKLIESQEVLKRIHKQCSRGMTFDEFLECWRNAEAPPPPMPPAHDELVKLCSVPGCGDGPKPHCHCTKCTLNTTHCHCAFCDNKQSYTRPGRKKRKRLTGVAM